MFSPKTIAERAEGACLCSPRWLHRFCYRLLSTASGEFFDLVFGHSDRYIYWYLAFEGGPDETQTVRNIRTDHVRIVCSRVLAGKRGERSRRCKSKTFHAGSEQRARLSYKCKVAIMKIRLFFLTSLPLALILFHVILLLDLGFFLALAHVVAQIPAIANSGLLKSTLFATALLGSAVLSIGHLSLFFWSDTSFGKFSKGVWAEYHPHFTHNFPA